jgi:hypothetical protein
LKKVLKKLPDQNLPVTKKLYEEEKKDDYNANVISQNNVKKRKFNQAMKAGSKLQL